MPIKLLLTAALGTVLAYAAIQRVAPRVVRMTLVAGGLVGLYFVWFPEHTTVIANRLGVGRGTDLVIYVWIVLSFAVGMNLNFKVRAARREITQLTRAIALATPTEPRPAERRSDEPSRAEVDPTLNRDASA